MAVGDEVFEMLDKAKADPQFEQDHEAHITLMVVRCLMHSSGFLHTGVSLGKRLDIEQYAAVRETVRRLQHVLDNQ